MEKIIFTDPENQEDLELYLLEQTCINGTTYLLAAEEEDDVELNAISKVFAEMLDDVDIEM